MDGRAEARGFVLVLSSFNPFMSKPKYFLYARKSTEDDDKQVMSIEAQLFELREFARRENLEILAEFQESKSAKTPGRPVFNEMMLAIDKEEEIGILAWHPDRLARNSIDGGRIIYLVDQGKLVSMRFPTFWFEPTPQGLFMLQVAFGQSKYYSDNLQENIRRGMRQKLRRGDWLCKAPLGYTNNPKTRNIEPVPSVSRVIKLAFEEYAKGGTGLEALAEFMAHHGVTTRDGMPLGKATVSRMLTNRVYIGLTTHKGEWYPGSFAPIISSKLFEDAQRVLAGRGKPRTRKVVHNFPFAGLFRCEECGGMVTAQWATGKRGRRYRYYRCTKKKGVCTQKYLREEELAAQIKDRLQKISLCDDTLAELERQLGEIERTERQSSQSGLQNLSEQIKAGEARLSKLVESYLDGDIPKELYVRKKDEILRANAALHESLKDFKTRGNNWVEPLREWISATKQANFLTNEDDLHQIRSFVEKIGTNPSVRDKTARFGVPVLSELVFAYNTKTDFAHAQTPIRFADRGRGMDDVSICGDVGNRIRVRELVSP